MGPSWYWMPDVFEHFFNSFGKRFRIITSSKALTLSYRVYWPGNEAMDVPADYEALKHLFESIEPGSGARLDQF